MRAIIIAACCAVIALSGVAFLYQSGLIHICCVPSLVCIRLPRCLLHRECEAARLFHKYLASGCVSHGLT
jgi:hypothetical protein